MDIPSLIKYASTERLNSHIVEQACSHSSVDIPSLFDEFANSIAREYLNGNYSYEYCDAAMNSLYAYAYSSSGTGLPNFAFSVYIAFDEGEYIHKEGPPEFDGEPRTKALLYKLLGTENA